MSLCVSSFTRAHRQHSPMRSPTDQPSRDAGLDAVLFTHRQDSDGTTADVVVRFEDGLYELGERQGSPYHETLQYVVTITQICSTGD